MNNDVQRNLLKPLFELRELFSKSGEQFPDISVMTRSGDTPAEERRRMVRRPPEILITTPESLNLLLSSRSGRSRLDGSQQALVPTIRKLSGAMNYWAGIDRATNTMINVSVWKSLADAKQMDTLAPMLALAGEFVKLGIVFERSIANYETLWQL